MADAAVLELGIAKIAGSGLCGSPRRSNGCARFVLDGVIPAAEVQETIARAELSSSK